MTISKRKSEHVRIALEEDVRFREKTTGFDSYAFIHCALPEMDFEVTRTIAAEKVVVTQWVFTGTNSGPLGSPIFESGREPTDRTIRFRGVSIYDVHGGLIQRETTYMDLATLMVELGVES